ncbi:glycoside hydrolase family 3 C-terminal domain-containing protein [Sphaerosporella brunnea]|uniref:beta-glucosidase n=1 Tax=Sphaerosporella brunnea TaxID=1250544 RepID=A0A5J5EIX6_9PEZI|nr:glycoside hydrolase family 3 C-terminal domain-containing protein [Sphaerosporella brunnea]
MTTYSRYGSVQKQEDWHLRRRRRYEDQEGYPNFCKDRGSGWGSGAVEYPHFHSPLTELKKAFNTSTDDIPAFAAITDNHHISSIEKSASDQDLCFAFINSDAGEGYIADPLTGVHGDRLDLYAQKGGDDLVKSVASRLYQHHSVVLAHLPGQESGKALVEILFGDSNPSGKLPYTIGKSLEDYGPGAEVMYHPNAETPQQTFSEGLEVDYRYFDAHGITPRFEFGFGLSYTTFVFTHPRLRQKLPKKPFPDPRPDLLAPPEIPTSPLPPVEDVLFPKGFKKVPYYIYPYLSNASEVSSPNPIGYPKDYSTVRPLSPAGGGEGGNPSLWNVIVELEVTVQNIGDGDGAEVVQLYIGFPEVAGVKFPVRVLRGLEKVLVASGEEKKVVFNITRRELSYWDVVAQNWRMPTEGAFALWVGSSSRDLPTVLEF